MSTDNEDELFREEEGFIDPEETLMSDAVDSVDDSGEIISPLISLPIASDMFTTDPNASLSHLDELSRDVFNATRHLTRGSARNLVDQYYQYQKQRIVAGNIII